MDDHDSSNVPKWQPLTRNQRRVAGVMIEKAKTTPDAYPLTLNALTTGCNQKSNRDPQMHLSPEEVEETLAELRTLGAVVVVEGKVRVEKFRHQLYEWLGVDKFEIAVLGELLLRGQQTVGELRGRAARMEPIKGLADLTPILETLIQRQLVISLTPPGRGQTVTHGLFQQEELERIKNKLPCEPSKSMAPAGPTPAESLATPLPATIPAREEVQNLQKEIEDLKKAVVWLQSRLAQLERQITD